MRHRWLPTAVLLALITAGCSFSTQEESPSPVTPVFRDEYKRPQPPATPLHGERVQEESLPAELSAWKEANPKVPGGISKVVGDTLYVLASPGLIGDDAHSFTIGDVKVLGQRVEVEAYLVRSKSGGKQVRTYPKDFVKIAYGGSAKELPVELNINYSDAAYAYPKGVYDVVDRAFLPDALRGWLTHTETSGGQSALFGDYLYVMVIAGERMKAGDTFRLGDVELKGDHVEVQAFLAQGPDGGPANSHPESVLFARLPVHGDKAPDVKVEILWVVLSDNESAKSVDIPSPASNLESGD